MRGTLHRVRGLIAVPAAIASLCAAGHCYAEAILAQHDWDTGTHGWTNQYGWTNLERQESGGNPDGWLQITFPETSEPEVDEDEWYDIAYTPASNLLAGGWSTGMVVCFDFWAEDSPPDALQIQWSSTTNSDVWGFVLTPPASTGVWTEYSASLNDWSDWDYPGATEDQFLADLASVDWIGVYIWRENASQEIYGIDMFQLAIPEPGEWLFAGSALLACWNALRRKRRAAA